MAKRKDFLKWVVVFLLVKMDIFLPPVYYKMLDRVWVEHKSKYFLTETIGSDSLCNLTLLKTLEKPEEF